MSGSYINIDSARGGFPAYQAGPSDAEAGIIVIQEIFGVNNHIQAVCEKLAALGYRVLAPDLFHALEENVHLGYDEASFQHGFALMQRLDREQALSEIGSCIDQLRDSGCQQVGVTGFCMGGLMSFLAAAQFSPDAAVAYYGGGIGSVLDQATKIQCPIMFHFGERDSYIPMSEVDQVRETMQDRAEIHVYPADHGFNCDERDSYDQSSAQQAWDRTTAFFDRYLRPSS